MRDDSVQDISYDREKLTDEKVREELYKILIDNNDKELLDILYFQSFQNFETINEFNESLSRKYKKFIKSLVLYYTAVYFNNEDLLRKLQSRGISFEDMGASGDIIDRLQLGILDSDLSSLFNEEDYINLIKESIAYISVFYWSVAFLKPQDKKKYCRIFANILNERKDFIGKAYESAFYFGNLKACGEETYLKATVIQVNTLINDYCDQLRTDEKLERFNKLIQNTNLFLPLAWHANINAILDAFTDEELSAMSQETFEFIAKVSSKYNDLNRIKFLCEKRPEFINYQVSYYADFLNTFSDKEILAMLEATIWELDKNKDLFFNTNYDRKKYDKKAAGKAKLFVKKTNFVNRFIHVINRGE